MSTIILTIPDEVQPRVVAAVATKFDYAKNKLAGETTGQFAKRMLIVTLKQWVRDSEVPVVYVTAGTAQAAIEQDIETNILIT
jgi:hypothetical protein